jgi:glucose/arabinose dehydrogenase
MPRVGGLSMSPAEVRHRRGMRLVATVLLLGLALGSAASSADAPTSAAAAITLVPIFTGLSSPVYVTHSRDGSGRLFAVEQSGRVLVRRPGGGEATVFLDIRSLVLSGGERGLLGLAFHPHYRQNGRFFVDYTRRPDGATVVAEYQASAGNPDLAGPAVRTWLVIPQPFANHNGGMVEFGPDGFLYIALGDGGSGNDPGNRAQDITQLLGKILRIDVDHPDGARPYSSPPGNPFFGAVAGADEIYAYGLRNPWRFSFDRGTGDLYVGDVGQGAVEEIDIVTLGGNYGWRIWEGTQCTGLDPGLCNPAGFIFPIAEYGHTGGRCAVTGGYVYRGTRESLPAGGYVYGDFCTGEIFLLAGGASSIALDTALNISSFGEDEAGELYVVGLGGTVERITHTGTFVDVPPSHVFSAWIEAIARAGITAGCATNPPTYCPDQTVTRGEMAVFLLRGRHGAGYTPPAASGIFADVPVSHPFAAWIEQLFGEGITTGCGTSPPSYCPDQGVTRGQMAVLLLRARHGAGFEPPPATGIFADVPPDTPFAGWIEQLFNEGITGGCGTSPARYCPDAPITRGQMAVFLVRAFGLPL